MKFLGGAYVYMKIDPPLCQNYKDKGGNSACDVTGWLVSEKFDGVRAIWNGSFLQTMNGIHINAPADWIASLPSNAYLDGELTAGRNTFETTSGAIRERIPDCKRWSKIRYLIFDCPSARGTLVERLDFLKRLGLEAPCYLVDQKVIASDDFLEDFYGSIIDNNGEGVVIRNPNAGYKGGKSYDNLKYKPTSDAEAVVVKIEEGEGKNSGRMGKLQVVPINEDTRKLDYNKTFKVGGGFTDTMRDKGQELFPIGTIITYYYRGKTNTGKPRFPVFKGRRNDKTYSGKLNLELVP